MKALFLSFYHNIFEPNASAHVNLIKFFSYGSKCHQILENKGSEVVSTTVEGKEDGWGNESWSALPFVARMCVE